VSASLKPMSHFGNNIYVRGKRGRLSYFKQIVAALNASTAEYVFFCEHDVLYHPTHFDYTPTDGKFCFNRNVVKWRYPEPHFLSVDNCEQVSGMCAKREVALKWYEDKLKKLENGEWDGHYEPQHNREHWHSSYPNVDIRHNKNITKNRWSPEEFRNKKYTEGWTESNCVAGWEL